MTLEWVIAIEMTSEWWNDIGMSKDLSMRLWWHYDEESDHSNKAVRKTPEIESGHKVSEEVKWT